MKKRKEKKVKDKRKRLKLKFNIDKILCGVLLILSIVLVVFLFCLDIIPNKYLYIILGVEIVANLLAILFCFVWKLPKKGKIIFRIFMILFAILSVVGIYYLNITYGFFNSISVSKYKTENYAVVVLKDSDYEELADLEGCDVGYYANEATSYQKANDLLLEKVDLSYIEYEEAFTLGESLLDEEVDAIVIENSYQEIIEEQIEEFASLTKVIYTFSIEIETKLTAKDTKVTEEPFSIFISGIDTYGKISSVSRGDVNMVATVNPTTHQVLLTSIPRDYYVTLNGIGQKDKLTHAGIYGIDTTIKTVEDLLDMEINYYIKVNFTSLIDLVNALDGVDVYSEYTFTTHENYSTSKRYRFTKGYNHVNGEEALAFARERKAFASGDNQRVKNQQALLTAIIKKACSEAIITKYSDILSSLEGEFDTNMGSDKITNLIKMQIDEMPSWTISSNSLTGRDANRTTYSYGSQKLYVMIPIESSVDYASRWIESVLMGETFDETYIESDDDVSDVVTRPSDDGDKSEQISATSSPTPTPTPTPTSTPTPTPTPPATDDSDSSTGDEDSSDNEDEVLEDSDGDLEEPEEDIVKPDDGSGSGETDLPDGNDEETNPPTPTPSPTPTPTTDSVPTTSADSPILSE